MEEALIQLQQEQQKSSLEQFGVDLTEVARAGKLGHFIGRDAEIGRLEDKRLTLGVTRAARLWLAEHGYDPVYRARPLRRLMQKEIDDRLANLLLAGKIEVGTLVKADVAADSEGLVVSTD